jgi:hypothetical protein
MLPVGRISGPEPPYGHLGTAVLRPRRRRMISLRRPELPRRVLAGRLRSREWMCLGSGDSRRRVGMLLPSPSGRSGGVAVWFAVQHNRTGRPRRNLMRRDLAQTSRPRYTRDGARRVTAPTTRSGDDPRGRRNEPRSPSGHRRTLEALRGHTTRPVRGSGFVRKLAARPGGPSVRAGTRRPAATAALRTTESMLPKPPS